MLTMTEIREKLERVFDKRQAAVLSEVIVEAHGDLVKASDFNELKGIVKYLAEAQKELAEAQKRTELRVEELAEAQKELTVAQKRTEEELRRLIREHGKTREQLGGLSMTVGYTLENESYKALPALLKEDFGIEVKGRLKREFVTVNKGRSIEINILGMDSGKMEN